MAIDYKGLYHYEVAIPYNGFKGINLDNLTKEDFSPLEEYLGLLDGKRYQRLEDYLLYLDNIGLEESRSLAKSFYDDHFITYSINYIHDKKLELMDPWLKTLNDDELYDAIDNEIRVMNPFNLEIFPIGYNSFTGRTNNHIIVNNNSNDFKHPKRKTIYHRIIVGTPINKVTSATLVHEVTHMEQSNKFGFANDFLNSELLPIFLEKVAIDELDPTGELLRISESLRFMYTLRDYKELLNEDLPISERITFLTYIKSCIHAIKLFDMYKHDPDKESYFKDIQSVFDGKKQVEDIIKSRKLDLPNCFGVVSHHI